MRIVLNDKDLAAMPAALRRGLLDHIAGESGKRRGMPLATTTATTAKAKAEVEAPAIMADRPRALALLRDISFHKSGKALHRLIEALAEKPGKPAPSAERLMKTLRLSDRRRLLTLVRTLDRVAVKQTGDPTTRLVLHDPAADSFHLHPRTRTVLRGLLGEMAHAGEHEEVLWA